MALINWFKLAFTNLSKYFLILFQPSSVYSRELPSLQQAVDLFQGTWTSRVNVDVKTGTADLFTEPRPQWAAQSLGGFQNKRVLELGPLEGGHTYQLEKLGADVTAIEGNKLAFQRCLIVKNILNLRSTFFLGDFISYLKATKEKFDTVFESGVLYHMTEPVEVLKEICRISDQVYLWTHYYDQVLIKGSSTASSPFKTERTHTIDVGGRSVVMHERKSVGFLVHLLPNFCGGKDRTSCWLTLDDIYWCLRVNGFEVVATADSVNGVHGPSISIAAQRVSADSSRQLTS